MAESGSEGVEQRHYRRRKRSPRYELLPPPSRCDNGKREKFLSNYLLLEQRIQQRDRACKKDRERKKTNNFQLTRRRRRDIVPDADEDEKLAFASPSPTPKSGSFNTDSDASEDERLTCCEHGVPCTKGLMEREFSYSSTSSRSGNRTRHSKLSQETESRSCGIMSYPLTTAGFSSSTDTDADENSGYENIDFLQKQNGVDGSLSSESSSSSFRSPACSRSSTRHRTRKF